ncbi:hypothetical protein A1O1_03317 [Capronia coronata CBS 617.96]|uniref:Histone deacetylase complex subunit SAP30 Sin3 binding domain-containing protein n=1 Tax=Capronia coronata CBS 617.96 TaxID=1182541 RepID=W9YCF9_9EURO|nr:uncharacterized protein A1O1_03317 [Capronia coronata CBS 617.96]EXJ90218.1 hypothetical protein A1O1_03317 [Capronia coronata CBS 617.96]
MPPARPRNIDDSRSEASSTVTNQKDKAALGPTSGSGVAKGKRLASNLNTSTTATKAATNGIGSVAAAPTDVDHKDPNLPRTEWNTMSTSILRTYRIAHRLSVPSAYNHPHAELTYTSSDIALRAPSVVQARRKLREQRHHDHKLQQGQRNGAGKGTKAKAKEKEKSRAEPPTRTAPSVAKSIEPPDPVSEQTDPSSSMTYIGPREPASQLATAVRKHFNAQQLNEADTIARFIYVVQQNGRGAVMGAKSES